MSLGITELQLTDVSKISIPTDAILILFLIIVFGLLGYFFHNIIDNQINQYIEKVDDNSHRELVKEKLQDKLTLESRTVNHEKSEKPSVKKLRFLAPSKVLGIGSLALVAIGGSSLLRVQPIQNSYKRIHTSQVNVKTENQSVKSFLSMANLNSSNQSQTKIQKVNYIDPLLSTNNSSNNNNFLQVNKRQTEDFFSF
tara:strand:+ start:804 stop:1394 length:591 start_codon:yes stop_codon:yes gene_type:complete